MTQPERKGVTGPRPGRTQPRGPIETSRGTRTFRKTAPRGKPLSRLGTLPARGPEAALVLPIPPRPHPSGHRGLLCLPSRTRGSRPRPSARAVRSAPSGARHSREARGERQRCPHRTRGPRPAAQPSSAASSTGATPDAGAGRRAGRVRVRGRRTCAPRALPGERGLGPGPQAAPTTPARPDDSAAPAPRPEASHSPGHRRRHDGPPTKPAPPPARRGRKSAEAPPESFRGRSRRPGAGGLSVVRTSGAGPCAPAVSARRVACGELRVSAPRPELGGGGGGRPGPVGARARAFRPGERPADRPWGRGLPLAVRLVSGPRKPPEAARPARRSGCRVGPRGAGAARSGSPARPAPPAGEARDPSDGSAA